MLVEGDRVGHRRHAVTFVPYRYRQLLVAVEAGGLSVVDTDYHPDRARARLVCAHA